MSVTKAPEPHFKAECWSAFAGEESPASAAVRPVPCPARPLSRTSAPRGSYGARGLLGAPADLGAHQARPLDLCPWRGQAPAPRGADHSPQAPSTPRVRAAQRFLPGTNGGPSRPSILKVGFRLGLSVERSIFR